MSTCTGSIHLADGCEFDYGLECPFLDFSQAHILLSGSWYRETLATS